MVFLAQESIVMSFKLERDLEYFVIYLVERARG